MSEAESNLKPGKLPPGEPNIDLLNDWPKTFGTVFAALRSRPLITVLVLLFSTFEGEFAAPLNSGVLSNTLLLVIIRQVVIFTYRDLGKTFEEKGKQTEVAMSLVKLAGLCLAYYVVCALLGVFLLVPGLWGAGAFALAEAILILEDISVVVAFKRSRELTHNYVVKTILYTGLVPTIFAMVVAISMGFVEGAVGYLSKVEPFYLHLICAGLAMAMIIVILLSTHVMVTRMYVRLRGPNADSAHIQQI